MEKFAKYYTYIQLRDTINKLRNNKASDFSIAAKIIHKIRKLKYNIAKHFGKIKY